MQFRAAKTVVWAHLVLISASILHDSEGLPGVEANLSENSEGHQEDDDICGTVSTASGDVIALREGTPLSSKEFDLVHVKRLRNALFSPKAGCIIRVCGFTSWSILSNPGYVGNGIDDITGCKEFETNQTSSGLPLFNSRFNASSLACACLKGRPKCKTDCSAKDHAWQSSECSILYQEVECGDCYFNPVHLRDGKQLIPDLSQQFLSIAVRPGCYVTQNMENSGKRVWLLRNATRIFHYYNITGSKQPNIQSAFQREPEIFNCSCDTNLPFSSKTEKTTQTAFPTTVSPITRASSTPQITLLHGGIIAAVATVGVVAIAGLGILHRRRKHTPSRNRQSLSDLSESTDVTLWVNSDYTESESTGTNANEEMMNRLKQYVQELMLSSRTGRNIVDILSDSAESANNDAGPDNSGSAVNLVDRFNKICKPDFTIPVECLAVGDKLGGGKFGNVFKGKLTQVHDGLMITVAVKAIKPHAGENVIKSFLREIEIFQTIGRHQHVVPYFGAACLKDVGELLIVTKFCERSSLQNYLRDVLRSKLLLSGGLPPMDAAADGEYISDVEQESALYFKAHFEEDCLSSKDLRQMMYWSEQISSGMEYITSKKIIHVDLAVRNILLESDLTARICDFGLSSACLEERDYMTESALSDSFPVNSIAPEFISSKEGRHKRRVSFAIDIWAFGCTVWEIFSLGEVPYSGKNLPQIIQAIRTEKLAKPDLAPVSVYNVLLRCWHNEPQFRPSFAELRDFFEERKGSCL